ncbi:hypothetical protein ACFV6G_03905 [Streptomyces lavendulae]|uniref:hypothetical protein n=1 Tax=Streptomyces lavendulae TaxID=1914 RepID=UPI0036C667FC
MSDITWSTRNRLVENMLRAPSKLRRAQNSFQATSKFRLWPSVPASSVCLA